MTLDYFYGQAGELFSFYRIPKALFLESRFQNLSTDAKTLYGILLDRISLSVKNGWLDEQGRVFIVYTIEDVKRALCCADNKATKLMLELEVFGLIERKRRGLGRPSLVYEHQAVLRSELSSPVSLGDDARGNIVRLDNALDSFSARLAELNALLNIDNKSKKEAPAETAEAVAPRPSVLAALEEKSNQPEPVKPFKSFLDKEER